MSSPHIEQPAAERVSSDSEAAPTKPTWQSWLEGFEAVCGEHNLHSTELTADKRPIFTIATADYLHRDTTELYAQNRQAETTTRQPVPLPHRVTHRRLYEYYRDFPAEPVDLRQDPIHAAARQRHQATHRTIAYQASGSFREIRIAQLLRSHYANNGQAEAAESMRELLAVYGMVVAGLRTYAHNAIHPPAVMGTAHAAETRPFFPEQVPVVTETPLDLTEQAVE
jgi:hypothetical protein